MADSRDFTRSPFENAWADNNWPSTIFLAGPPVAGMSQPSGWVVTNGGSAARTGQGTGVKLPLPSFSRRSLVEKLFRIRLGGLMAWCMPRGWPLVSGSFRPVGERSTKDYSHLHVEKSDEASPVYSVLSRLQMAEYDTRWRTLIKFSCALGIQREKDGIRRPRRRQYLTRVRRVATFPIDLATLPPQNGKPERLNGNP
jgi:hypothetical protein